MSIKTAKKKVSRQKIEDKLEKSKHEQSISDLLACEREFSLLQQKAMDEMKKQHAHVVGKLQQQNESLELHVKENNDEIKSLRMFLHAREQEHYDAIKKFECQMDAVIIDKDKEMADMKQNYEKKIEEMTKHCNAIELELFEIKMYVKPHADACIQTEFIAPKALPKRMIPLKEHLESIRIMKDKFAKEKFELQESILEQNKRDGSSDKELDLSCDKHTLPNHVLKCHGSKLIVELEKYKNENDVKKMQDLLDYNLQCLNKRTKLCNQQQETIQKLQDDKREQDIKVQILTQQIQEYNKLQTVDNDKTENSPALTHDWDEIYKIKEMAQNVLDQRSEVEQYFSHVIEYVKEKGNELKHETKIKNGINGLKNGVSWKLKEEFLQTLINEMTQSNGKYNFLKEKLANIFSHDEVRNGKTSVYIN